MITAHDLDAHVAWCQDPARRDGWTPARDLVLAESLCRGAGLARTAQALSVPEARAQARWDALYPAYARSVTLQPVLLRTLRRNAEAARLRSLGGGAG